MSERSEAEKSVKSIVFRQRALVTWNWANWNMAARTYANEI